MAQDSRTPPPQTPVATAFLLLFGLLAFGVASLSMIDMMLPRPYDGVALAADAEKLRVAEVVPGSGAARAGLVPGDRIVGVGRRMVATPAGAARVLNDYRIGDKVLYLVKRESGLDEVQVTLDRRRIGDGTYIYASALGFAFFFISLLVLVRQPAKLVSQVFFVMGCLFMMFLVCRLRPASYSGIDTFVLSLGTGAFLLLPPAFLHFYLLFPRPAWIWSLERKDSGRAIPWLVRSGWPVLYLLPLAIFFVSAAVSGDGSLSEQWLSGAPLVGWWMLAIALAAGLAALRANVRGIESTRERRGAAMIFFGSVVGLLPFAAFSLLFPDQRQTTAFALFALGPLALLPITFTYAIVRFQLLDIRIILRRSLLYTVTTALVTGVYAGGIATFNAFFRNSDLAASGYFPVVLALAIVLLFDPLRRRVQKLLESFFFAGRSRLEGALAELGEAMAARADLEAAVRDLVDRLPQILGCRFAALYVARGNRLERRAGPAELPTALPVLDELRRSLDRRRGATRIDDTGSLVLRSADAAQLIDQLSQDGVEWLVDLSSKRRWIGLLLFSERTDQAPFEPEERALLDRLFDQATVALETGLLLEERTRQAELEREMEIAATIQARLLPDQLRFAPGWTVAAKCQPSRIVGGDFIAELPTAQGDAAVVFGDVSGKSVSAALVMMAAHEALSTLSMAIEGLEPERLFDLANRRIYALGHRSFVALSYFGASADGDRLCYLVAGQPPPILRRADGTVEELALSPHRLPIGAMPGGGYTRIEISLEPGDVVLGYSDGVTDARAPGGEFFGDDRLFDIVGSIATSDPQELIDRVMSEIRTFARGDLLYDDVTLVAVARAGRPRPTARDRTHET